MKPYLTAIIGLLLLAPALTAQDIYGLQSGGTSLTKLTSTGSLVTNIAITGLGGDSLIDLDFFTSGDGQLYGMGATGTLYTIDRNTGAATVNVASTGTGSPTAIDFNPVADRLRVFSGDNNFRVTPGVGTLSSDGMFSFASGDVNFGADPTLVAAAYTRNFDVPVTTQLYSIDAGLDILVLHAGSPTFSSLTTVATLTLGGLTFNAGVDTGFDIFSLGGSDLALLSSGNNLYSLNLATGVLTFIGATGTLSLTDIAAVPEPGTFALLGLGGLGLVLQARRHRKSRALLTN